MKEKIFKKGLSKRILSLVVALAMMITLMPGMSVEVKADSIYTVSNKDDFLTRMKKAKDGDVIKLDSNITLNAGSNGNGDCFVIPQNCLVTLDLNDKRIEIGAGSNSNNVGVGANSALLIKNGTFDNIDTKNDDTGILILSNVKITGKVYLGQTQTWIVNNSKVAWIRSEDGSVNPGSELNPRGKSNKLNDEPYNYDNPAPAMVGSGVTWQCLQTLAADFSQAQTGGDTYKYIIFLKNSTLEEDSNLSASGKFIDLAGYTLTTGDKVLSLSHESGENNIRNGKIVGGISMSTGSGAVRLSNLDVTENISNVAHPVTIESGHYHSITGGMGKVTITGGFYSDVLQGNNYAISAGYFVNRPDDSYPIEGYDVVEETKVENDITYFYTVKPHVHDWEYPIEDGNKITATCKKNTSHKLELTITANNQAESDSNIDDGPTIIYGTPDEQSAWTGAGLKLPGSNGTGAPTIEKKYYATNENGAKIEPALNPAPPTGIGNYIVDVTVKYGSDDKKATVSLPYSIVKGADPTGTVTGGQGKVTVTGMKDEQEYIVTTEPNPDNLTENDWNGIEPSKIVGPDGVVTGLKDGATYYVYTRNAAHDGNPAGKPVAVGGPYYTNVPRPENNVTGYTIDDDNKIHITSGYEVFSDEACQNPVADGDILSPDTTYYIRKAADGDNPASEPFAFKLGKDVAPTGLGTVPNSGEGTSDGKITGVTPGMTYSTDGGNTWNEVGSTANEITGLSSGSVLVRFGTSSAYTTLWIGAGPSPSYESDGSGHVHEFEWGNWNRVTKDENGIMVYQCKLCGYVLEKEYIPAYAYTCLTESEHVLKTPQNGSVICEMGRWNAYPRWFFEKLATRPDVNITLKFLYQNKQYTVSIPAGTKIDTEHDWYGPLKICSLYNFEVK